MATGVESTSIACAQAGELGKKRPRSLSPTDSKICEVANSILSKDEALPLIQNMYSKATWRSPKVISLTHLAERRFLLRKSDDESPVILQGYFSKEMIAEGGESQLFPVLSKEGKGYFFLLRVIHTPPLQFLKFPDWLVKMLFLAPFYLKVSKPMYNLKLITDSNL